MEYPITGIDVSRYQGEMSYSKAVAQGAKFCAVRVTVGNWYTDTQFPRSWDAALDEGLKVTGYHVVKPSHSAGSQMSRFFEALDGRLEDFPLVLDCEVNDGQSVWVCNSRIKECAEYIKRETGDYPIIYTAAWWWNNNTYYDPLWRECDLWVANYTLGFTPYLPRDWQTWKFWQWSADGNNMGRLYGAESDDIDLNRFNGTELDWIAYLGEDAPPPVGEKPMLESTVSLNVRTSGSIGAPVIGQLATGEAVSLLELNSPRGAGEVWAKIERETGQIGYCAWYYGGRKYLQVID